MIRAETRERAFLLDEQIIRVFLCIFTQRNRKQGKGKEILSIFVLVYNLIRFHAEISACEPFFVTVWKSSLLTKVDIYALNNCHEVSPHAWYETEQPFSFQVFKWLINKI